MKLFKKALLATAVLGAMGAQAATINNDKFKLSSEGIALEVPAVESEVFFDIKVTKDHASGSFITLTFDDNVDITAIEAAADGSVTQTVGGGTSQSGDVYFDYGTGSFTFDNVTVTQANKTKGIPASISFNVNLGNPLTANSAFRIQLASDGDIDVPLAKILGSSTLQYKSTVSKTDTTVIETGSAVISEEVSQFSFAVGTKLDGLIKRDKATKFVGVNDTDVDADSLVYTLTNDESLGMALRDVDANIRFDGNFKGLTKAATQGTNTDALLTVTMATSFTDTFNIDDDGATTPVTDAVVDTYSYGDTAAVTPAIAGVKETYVGTLDFANVGQSPISIPVTGDVDASVTVVSYAEEFGGTAITPASGYSIVTKVDAGEWAIDATIINVPYLPINATNTDTFIHFANETDKEVDVIVTAIDNSGNEYGPMNLGYKLPANTVKKFSEKDMDTFFGLDGVSTKLSVTFNVDADKGDVSAYAVSQNDKGRTEVSTSQQRGN